MPNKKTIKEITLDDKVENKSVAIPHYNKEKKLQELKEETTRRKKEMREKKGITPLNDKEKALIERWKGKKIESLFNYEEDDNDHLTSLTTKTENGTSSEQFEVIAGAFSEATGTSDFTFAFKLLTKCIQASCIGTSYDDQSQFASLFNSITNVLTGMKPVDEIEGMLITRLIAIHTQSMHYLSCAANKEATIEGRDSNINRSTKLFRVYNETLEALMRYRRRGEQRVVVQHVNVNDGAQAMIGHFQAGGGVSRKNEEPHG